MRLSTTYCNKWRCLNAHWFADERGDDAELKMVSMADTQQTSPFFALTSLEFYELPSVIYHNNRSLTQEKENKARILNASENLEH